MKMPKVSGAWHGFDEWGVLSLLSAVYFAYLIFLVSYAFHMEVESTSVEDFQAAGWAQFHCVRLEVIVPLLCSKEVRGLPVQDIVSP